MTTDRTYWQRHYYEYLEKFVAFSMPAGARESGCYQVLTDALGRVADVQETLAAAKQSLPDNGRLIVTQYSALWEPVLRLATRLGLRRGPVEQNWLSLNDLRNFAYLSGFDVVKSGTKMLLPVYIPLLSAFMNAIVANIWPFSHLGLFHYVILRKPEQRLHAAAPTLSVIVPARNEAGTIERIVREVPELGAWTEIVFVESGSTDDTWAEIRRVTADFGKMRRIRAIQETRKGKGAAVRAGFEAAAGDILAIYDADMTVPPAELAKFYDAIVGNKGDFVNGSRLVYPLEKDSMRVLNFFGNKFFSLAFSWILGQPLKDTLCGTKVLWRADYQKVKDGRAFFGDFDPFGDFDLLFGAAKLNLRIVDMPVHYKQRTYGSTNISRWKHGWLLLKMTVFAARKLKFR